VNSLISTSGIAIVNMLATTILDSTIGYLLTFSYSWLMYVCSDWLYRW